MLANRICNSLMFIRVFRIHFRYNDNVLSSLHFIKDSKCHGPPRMHTGHFIRQRFQILWVYIFAAHDNHVFFTTRNKHFTIVHIPIITRKIPAIPKSLLGKVRAVVIARQQAIALNNDLTDQDRPECTPATSYVSASKSCGYTFLPPTIIMSFLRPETNTSPLFIYP